MGYSDRTTLNNLTPNMDIGDVADPALRLAAFQYLYNLSDTNFAYLQSMVTSGTLSPYPPADYNKLINGNFDVWQRGTSFTGSGLYTADRWRQHHDHTSISTSVQTVYTPIGSKNVIRMENITKGAGTFYILTQNIETNNCIPFIGRTCTLSLKLRKNSALVSGNLVVSINVTTNIDDGNAYNGGSAASTTIDLSSLTTSFQQFSITASIGDTVRTIAIRLLLQSPTDGGYIEVSQAQLCAGDIALPFQPRSIGEELALCQRYYQKSFPYATAPTQNAGNNGAQECMVANNIAGGGWSTYVRLGKTMRVAPTITFYNPAATNAFARNLTLGNDAIGTDSDRIADNGFNIVITNPNPNTWTVGRDFVAVQYGADAEL